MTLTFAQALCLEAFSGADPRVLAGEENLDREVRWVHSSEIPDVARFLSGGELLLTAGLGIGSTEQEQREYVRAIQAAGATGLVIEESGRRFHQVPEAVVDEAARCGLPVVALGREIPFAAVSAQVHEVLTKVRTRSLVEERNIDSAFTSLLLAGGDHLSILRELAQLTSAFVVLENLAHQVVAGVGGTTEELEHWDRHAHMEHATEDVCLMRPVLTRGHPWGWIHVMDAKGPGQKHAGFAADRAAAAVAISLLSDHSREARDGQRATALITRLVLGDLTGPEFIDRAVRLGHRIGRGDLVVVVVNKDLRSQQKPPRAAQPPSDNAIQADMGDYLVLITLASSWKQESSVGRNEWQAQGGGVSREVPAALLPTAITQARSAAGVSRSLGTNRLVRFDDLGVERLLITLAQGPELAGYVQDELGPLLAHDARAATPLLPTLRAYLSADGNKSDAAQDLHVQRRTLYNRLDRIAAILGRRLDEVSVRQSLLLALKGLDLMEGAP